MEIKLDTQPCPAGKTPYRELAFVCFGQPLLGRIDNGPSTYAPATPCYGASTEASCLFHQWPSAVKPNRAESNRAEAFNQFKPFKSFKSSQRI
jgi:hypothetical protein